MKNNDPEELQTFAVFALPEDYAHHIGEVASIGSDGLRVVRRQISISAPYRIEVLPFSEVSRVEYENKLAPARIVVGVVVLLLLACALYGLAVYWDDLAPGTSVRYGLFALAVAYGLNWTFKSRSHRFTFHLCNGKRVKWRSRSGDFKYKTGVTSRAVERLTELGLFVPNPEVR